MSAVRRSARSVPTEAGRDLDVAVHEEALGSHAHRLHAYARLNRDPSDDYVRYGCRGRGCEAVFVGLKYREGSIVCPRYSTDANDALYLASLTGSLTARFLGGRPEDERWRVSVGFPKGIPRRGEGYGATFPEALSKAVLNTVRRKEERV